MKFRKKKGQSLVEVIFAVGVVGIMVAGIAILVTSTLGSKRRVLERSDAVKLAQSALEDMTILEKNNPSLFWQAGMDEDCASGDFDCEHNFDLSPVYCPGGETCMEITTRVDWDDGQTRQVVLSKFFHRD